MPCACKRVGLLIQIVSCMTFVNATLVSLHLVDDEEEEAINACNISEAIKQAISYDKGSAAVG